MIKEYCEFGFAYKLRPINYGIIKGDKAKLGVISLRLGWLYDDPSNDSDEDNDGRMTGLMKIFVVKNLLIVKNATRNHGDWQYRNCLKLMHVSKIYESYDCHSSNLQAKPTKVT